MSRPSPSPRTIVRRGALAALSIALVAPSSAALAAPLDDVERARAEALAGATPWTESRDAARRAPDGAAADGAVRAHALGVQTLIVEDAPRKGAPASERHAGVYQYDHGRQRTRRVLVDLAADAALETRALASPHLPLNEAERRWALARLAAEPALLERLRAEQRRRGEVPFATLDELDVKALVYEPTDPDAPCARERCALLSLFDRTRTVFTVEPIVRFASGAVEALDASRAAR